MVKALRSGARLSRQPFPPRVIACLFLAAVSFAQRPETFKLRLTPVSMDAAMKVNIAGIGHGSAELVGNTLNLNATFEGLLSPATTAQIRRGSATGVRGPAILDLKVSSATSGAVSGSFGLTADQVESLRKGLLYVQIASEKAPDGNLWGWLLQ